jgi:hypothetical protein
MRYIGTTGAGCGFKEHDPFTSSEWELCALQDLDRGADLLRQGMDVDLADQRLWEDACREQEAGIIKFHQNIYCCHACAFTLLTSHSNDKRLARSMMLLAQARNKALLLCHSRHLMATKNGISWPINRSIQAQKRLC